MISKHLAAVLSTIWLLPTSSFAQPIDTVHLTRDVDREQGVRDIRDLGSAYAQYSQYGMWNEMAGLFANNAQFIDGYGTVKGRSAIAAYFRKHFGHGRDGLAAGAVATRLEVTPVVNIAADGKSAKARWHELAFTGQYGVSAAFEGAIEENDYVKEDGRWKIKIFHSYPQFAGPYDTGWKNVVPDLTIVPYHYTPGTQGQPVALPADDSDVPKSASLHDVSQRIAAMNDADAVRNMQNIFGYYLDRRMWNDVTDLFAEESSYEIASVGVYDNIPAIRSAFEMDGPAGLKYGQMRDHVYTDEIVQVMPGGMEARIRGIEFDQSGDTGTQRAALELAVFDNCFIKVNGIWRIREMRVYPVLDADYYQGWAKSRLAAPVPGPGHEPSRPSPVLDTSPGAVPEFFAPNPGSGMLVTYPDGTHMAANELLLPAIAKAPDYPDLSLMDAEHQLAIAKAYDGTVNISFAFGNYIDDFQWPLLANSFAKNGLRQKVDLGFYMGPERILKAELLRWGPPKSPRTSIPIHLRMQPVVFVAADAQSTKLRTRLFSISSSLKRSGDFSGGGMYPDDGAVLENGTWKLTNAGIDEFYWRSKGWKDGWARDTASSPARSQPAPSPILSQFPPDIALKDMALRQYGFEAGTGPMIEWPRIKPMWFSYRNPVSGRTPEYYCPEIRSCYKEPRLQLTGRESWGIE